MRALALVPVLFFAMSGQANAEPRDLTGFSRIEASGRIDVEATLGPAHSVDVSGPGIEGVQTSVRGDVLVITWGPQGGLTRERPVVRVTTPQLGGVRAVNGAQVSASGLTGGDLTLQAAGSGELIASGQCRTLLATADSAGDLDASALTCEYGRVRASSGGEMQVNVTTWIEVSASSGADVSSLGTPTYGPVEVSSGAELHRGLRDGG